MRKTLTGTVLLCTWGVPVLAAEEAGGRAQALSECVGIYAAAADWMSLQKNPRVGSRVYALRDEAAVAAMDDMGRAGIADAAADAYIERQATAARQRMETLLADGDQYALGEALEACAALRARESAGE